MGNCLVSCNHKQRDQMIMKPEEEQQEHHQVGGQEADGFEKGAFRVKILVSKEELGWLLLLLREKGAKRLEDVLVEMRRGRERTEGWKPSLESIKESPELHSLDVNG